MRQAPQEGGSFRVLLACGCAPLHLKTFLNAHLQQLLPQRRVEITEGIYGDLAGTLERASSSVLQGIALIIEWSDLDPRLGHRSTGRWSLAGTKDTLQVTVAALERIAALIAKIPVEVRIALSLPTLPFPPLFTTPGWQTSEIENEFDRQIALFSAEITRRRNLALMNQRRLAEDPSFAARFDLKSELLVGFPYSMEYTDALASISAGLIAHSAPKKGIITDLDGTMWDGIVGEIGPESVSWDFSRHHHLHALYQNLLSSLAEQGVLLGVASKNDATVVEKAFERSDLLLRPESIFPFEVHWQAKSSSVDRILKTWNIAADSVIFVDDSPLELAEVAARHPGIHCLQFQQADYAAGLAMLREIRDLCGKERISEEDGLRLNSIRQGAEFRRMTENGETPPESFLKQVGATIVFDFSPSPEDSRVLELVNKTNQFNLNGLRRAAADWQQQNERADNVVAVIGYEDKFGPLGKIAVLQGHRNGAALHLDTWVMSCRAFSRHVEHQCLRVLFDRFQMDEIVFDYKPTAKNGPLREFFEGILGQAPEGKVSLKLAEFEAHCPTLFHKVISTT
jgi:FkbH-like protein